MEKGSKWSEGNVIIGIIFILLIFGLINLVLYIGQELYYRDEVKKCETIEPELNRRKVEIKSLEDKYKSRLNEMKYLITSLDVLKTKLQDYKLNYNDYASYKRDLEEYNKGVDVLKNYIDLNNRDGERYEALISIYNRKVDEYNKIAKKAYARWYLIPIPIPRGGKGISKILK